MESEEALKYYLDEVKDTQNDINNIEEEIHLPNGKSMSFVLVFYCVRRYELFKFETDNLK